MKPLHKYLLILTISTCTMTNIFADLNNFGISTIIPPQTSFSDDLVAFEQRIAEEFGDEFTLQTLLNFMQNIQNYYNYLLNTNNQNPIALEIAKLALIDIKKAKKRLKSNHVDAQGEHDLRVGLISLDMQINPSA